MTPERGQTLSHYRLVQKIGEGGMGVVWKALDTTLGRHIAIKVLPAELTADPERRRRFLREARTAAAVTHPNIATIHEIDEVDGITFISMELVEGRTLRSVIGGHPIPIPEALRIATEIAEGLARAHQAHIVHRDLKPDNVIIGVDGHPKILDFGLAKLVEQQQEALRSQLSQQETRTEEMTREGRILGTAAYMSPQQVRGEAADARSDIFSFGVTLYEMVTGRVPFHGHNQIETLAAILHKSAAPASRSNAEVPARLEEILGKCLEKNPRDRYQSCQDLVVDLRRMGRDLESGSSPQYEALQGTMTPARHHRLLLWGAAFVLILCGLVGGVWVLVLRSAPTANADTILILPMEMRGQAVGGDYVGQAFAEAIAVNLALARQLKVLPVPEAAEVGDGGAQARGRGALKVGAGRLLTGALTRDANAVHVSLSLLDAEQNRILWGVQKDAGDTALPELAASLARDVRAQLGATGPRLYDFDLYLKGSPAMADSPELSAARGAMTRVDLPAALAATKRLVEAFPNEPDAHVLRMGALFMTAWHSGRTSEEWEAWQESMIDLNRLDPNSPNDELLRANMLQRDGKHREALELLNQILTRDDLTPALRAQAIATRSQSYAYFGDHGSALADAEEAVRLNPLNDLSFLFLGAALNESGRLEEALTRARQAVALNPTPQNNNFLGEVQYRLGRYEESLSAFADACGKDRIQEWCGNYAVALLRAGHVKEAEAAAADAIALAETDWGAFTMARFQVVAGNRKEALHLLRRSLDLGPADPNEIAGEPDFAPLHGDPGFEEILAEARTKYRNAIMERKP